MRVANVGRIVDPDMVTRVLLVDDHALFRDGLKALLRSDATFSIVAECGEAKSAVEAAQRLQPDLAVVDIQLPGANGVSVARDIARVCRRCRVVALTMHDGDPFIVQALDAGVAGYVLKDEPPADVLEALVSVARGRTYISPRVPKWIVERQFRRSRGEDVAGDPVTELSAREREVFDLVVRGFTNEATARELGISVKTVETHRARINRKLGVHSTGELVRFAAVRGLVGAA